MLNKESMISAILSDLHYTDNKRYNYLMNQIKKNNSLEDIRITFEYFHSHYFESDIRERCIERLYKEPIYKTFKFKFIPLFDDIGSQHFTTFKAKDYEHALKQARKYESFKCYGKQIYKLVIE